MSEELEAPGGATLLEFEDSDRKGERGEYYGFVDETGWWL